MSASNLEEFGIFYLKWLEFAFSLNRKSKLFTQVEKKEGLRTKFEFSLKYLKRNIQNNGIHTIW